LGDFWLQRRRVAEGSPLPFPEKVRAVMQLQIMAAPILRARGKIVRVWRLEGLAKPAGE
jgi:hypothetical protein